MAEDEPHPISPVEHVYGALLERFRRAHKPDIPIKDNPLMSRVHIAIGVLEEFWPVDTLRWQERFRDQK